MSDYPFRRAMSCAVLSLLVAIGSTSSAAAAQEVNIYSYRQPSLIKPLLDGFTRKTGIKANVIFAKKGLIERIAAEGANSPADVLLTVDIGRLTGAVEAGVTQPVSSKLLETNIPAQYRDSKGHWFGLTRRARVVFASRERVKQKDITYEELADPKWKGKICIRSGHHVYNVALFASMMAHHGEQKAESWLKGLKANLARKPAGNDRAQVKGVYAGECDLAIGNTYYMGKMQTNDKKPEQKEWAKAVRVMFPNSNDRGTHVNLSGMVLAKHAPHKANAIKLMEYLVSDEAQRIYAEANFEYPVKPGVPWSKLVKSWGSFKADGLPLETIARLRKKASELVDKVAFDEGPSS
ncbi:MAG: Fe(3+) ABC transporter substrate-binding protein [Methyloligellaceae bacterium]